MIIILALAFIVAAYFIYVTIGFVELLKYSLKTSVAVSIISLILIIPLGVAYLFIGLIHVLLGRAHAWNTQ